MLQNTRALQRATAAASARAAVTSRRPTLLFGAATAAILGIALTVGFTSASAAGAENGAPAPAAAQLIPGTVPLAKIADEASTSLVEARGAVTAAENLAANVVSSGLDVGPIDATVDTSELRDGIDALKERDVMPPMILAVRSPPSSRRRKRSSQRRRACSPRSPRRRRRRPRRMPPVRQRSRRPLPQRPSRRRTRLTGRRPRRSRWRRASTAGEPTSSPASARCGTRSRAGTTRAHNPSGATGIPQALPGSKMASAGADWQTNAATQIAWGLGYISSVYGTPCSAWGHSQATNWY